MNWRSHQNKRKKIVSLGFFCKAGKLVLLGLRWSRGAAVILWMHSVILEVFGPYLAQFTLLCCLLVQWAFEFAITALAHAVRQEIENRGKSNEKKVIKILCLSEVIANLENPTKSTEKLLYQLELYKVVQNVEEINKYNGDGRGYLISNEWYKLI